MPGGIEAMSGLTLAVLNIATLDPNPEPQQPQKQVQKYTYRDGQVESIETFTRPDPGATKVAPQPIRQDFFNPLQTQIQMGNR
jgi:hypothetical protein